MWLSTRRTALAAQLDLHPVKSGFFTTQPEAVDYCLSAIPVAARLMILKDLGVQHSLGEEPEVPLLMERCQKAGGVANRIGMLPTSYKRRAHMVAAAVVPTGLFGASVSPLPAASLRTLRSAASRAVWRGGRYAAPECKLLLADARAKADPAAQAAFAPLLQLARALRHGWTSVEVARSVVDGASRSGPVRALQASLTALRLGRDPLKWSAALVGDHAGGEWDPAKHPLQDTQCWLTARWQALAAVEVARRRQGFAGASGGVEWRIARRALQSADLPRDEAGALLALMAGDVVLAPRASHWNGAGRGCTHCPCAEQSVEHLLWECPAWHDVRASSCRGRGADLAGLVRTASPLTKHCLLREGSPELAVSLDAHVRMPLN